MKARQAGPLRVAIVGLGPKGLFALERLASRAAAGGGCSIQVEIFEPHPAPGAGPVYDPAQPGYLLMNFDAAKIDMWPADEGPSYLEWCAKSGTTTRSYPQRADVGRYLEAGFATVVARARGRMDVSTTVAKVDRIERAGSEWRVHASGSTTAHDEVLITVGHAGTWSGALTTPANTPIIPAVFPVDRWLSRDAVPAGAKLGMRGFALTAIDACLALTEGRGGSFATGSHAHDLRYRSGADEVKAIVPFTRTGRPMLAKPDPSLGPDGSDLDPIAADARRRIAQVRGVAELSRIVAEAAEQGLHSLGAEATALDLDPARPLVSGNSVEQELQRSIDVAVGRESPGVNWALGHGWRAMYPAIVDRLGRDGLPEADWPRFRLLAIEMERVAFGPPPENAAKLLALIRAGKIDTAHLRGEPSEVDVDLIVDAVLPPPGAPDGGHPLLDRLLEGGHARIPKGRRGLELTADITCVGASGEPSHGLGAIGRPTEDWIIGNDTLSRTLHHEPDLWAQRVVGRATA